MALVFYGGTSPALALVSYLAALGVSLVWALCEGWELAVERLVPAVSEDALLDKGDY